MPFAIVDNRLIVKLRSPDAETIVGVRGRHEKMIVLQEASHKLAIFRRRLSEDRLFRAVVEAPRKLRKRTFAHQLLEMAINRI